MHYVSKDAPMTRYRWESNRRNCYGSIEHESGTIWASDPTSARDRLNARGYVVSYIEEIPPSPWPRLLLILGVLAVMGLIVAAEVVTLAANPAEALIIAQITAIPMGVAASVGITRIAREKIAELRSQTAFNRAQERAALKAADEQAHAALAAVDPELAARLQH